MTDLQQTAAILWLSTQACVVCRGTKADDGAQSDVLPPDFGPCPDCLGPDGKPTGLRFLTLSQECPCITGDESTTCTRCGDTGRVPISWRDERTIRLEAQAQGIRVEHQHSKWYVKLPGIMVPNWGLACHSSEVDDDLAIAFCQAVKAQEARYEGYKWVI